MFLPKKETDNIMIAQDNNPFGSRFLSPKMKALLNNYTQAEKAKSAVTKPTSYTAEKKDSFLEGFNDPYGEKKDLPHQSLAQRMMSQIANPVRQTPQSPMIKTEEPKYTFPFAENSKKNESTQKVEDDAFLEGFNYYNDKELMFPNTELRAKPKNYGIMFPNTELHASPSKNKSEDDAFKEGFNDPYGEKKEEKEKNWLQTGLDWTSAFLTGASLVPGWDTASNALQLLVDLGRGDYTGAALDAAGIIPFIGEAADFAKYGKAGNAAIDGIKAADKVADGIKTAEAMSDGIKIADDVADGAKTVDKAHDAAKTTDIAGLSKRDRLLSKATNQKVKEAVNQIYRPNAQIGDGGLGDAIRHELATGDLVGGKSHIKKGQERLKNLENILKSENLSPDEERMVRDLIDDLQKALKGE